ncbi:MAG: hypothetical protein IPL99_25195, partial [Candidatus Competibacteraceae bacterium]|nr:hypothetical protein [Candidatus Competibacteraceae bacterium]
MAKTATAAITNKAAHTPPASGTPTTPRRTPKSRTETPPAASPSQRQTRRTPTTGTQPTEAGGNRRRGSKPGGQAQQEHHQTGTGATLGDRRHGGRGGTPGERNQAGNNGGSRGKKRGLRTRRHARALATSAQPTATEAASRQHRGHHLRNLRAEHWRQAARAPERPTSAGSGAAGNWGGTSRHGQDRQPATGRKPGTASGT